MTDKVLISSSLRRMSNPEIVYRNAQRWYGKNVIIDFSTNPKKKYMIYNPFKNLWIHFGQNGYEDYTYHQDKRRQQNYLKRSMNIKGKWKLDPYSPNNLSRNLLWT